ncbi:MAG: porin family protein [Gammaproteobacteria bacterium]|nr:MAG: porin family protein [Gammaproteobacteria bacterium]
MKKIFLSAIFAFTLCSSPFATADSKYYCKVGLGNLIGTMQDTTNEVESGGDSVAFAMEAKGGVAISLGLGYKVNKFLSSEFTLQQNLGNDLKGDLLIDGITIAEATGFNTESIILTEVDTLSFMATAKLDINQLFQKEWPVEPYVGLGVGFAKNSLDEIVGRTIFEGVVISQSPVVSGGNSSGFAWRFLAGLTRPINKKYAVDLHYQYSNYGSVAIYDNGDGREIDLTANEIILGLRYNFR